MYVNKFLSSQAASESFPLKRKQEISLPEGLFSARQIYK